jgi:putative transposase
MRSLNADAVPYRGFCYPAEVISYYVWRYHRFPLSFRDVEE